MFVYILKILGVTPAGRKSGKREAAWAVVAITLGLTVTAIALGIEMVAAMQPVLMMLWPVALSLLAGAYKLEHDKITAPAAPVLEEATSMGYQPGVSEGLR